MKRTLTKIDFETIPLVFHELLNNSEIYDSSCSPEARVFFIDKDEGYFLKKAPKNSLIDEVALTKYFHKKGLATDVVEYASFENDWMLTKKVVGEDCTFQMYLDAPKRLCDTIATLLRQLHETDFTGCPIKDRCNTYIKTVIDNYNNGAYDKSAFPDSFGYKSAEDAWNVAKMHMYELKNDTLLHGDYCLPNIMLDNWRFSKFIDLGNGGVGDRHIDVFWGIWTLFFNLKTNEYASRFIDAYGRNLIDKDMLRVVAACEVFG